MSDQPTTPPSDQPAERSVDEIRAAQRARRAGAPDPNDPIGAARIARQERRNNR
ncbi:hypothetical protein [Nakamurella leprariae]|uniref:Uncharacterized protein n=1 Tax=Nakamurella leprariae TaxID=2803911 RepID=A0A938Y5D9_9ACTN|nr:hypothetical protein [Nakamurella leprariae]MBM9466095.1 hypothetical protein [Nakamurella leprariae]